MRQSILLFLLLVGGGRPALSWSALSVPRHRSTKLQPSTSSATSRTSSNTFVIQKVGRSRTSFSKSSLFSTTASSSSIVSTGTLPEGLIKTVSKPGYGPLVQLGDIVTIKYACYVADQSKAFARSAAQKMAVGDGTMIPGWDAAVRSMRVGERSVVRLENADRLAYGAAGVYPVIPPNAILELDLEILEAAPATANIDFDALAEADATPRTAVDIAAAYQVRQAAKAAAGTEELEGLEAFLAKAKNFYFYGLFEGETGERPPWFLRPSITFPLAFLIVGATFYISYVSGAITERGAQTTDELDQIIISSSNINALWTTALMAIKVGPVDF